MSNGVVGLLGVDVVGGVVRLCIHTIQKHNVTLELDTRLDKRQGSPKIIPVRHVPLCGWLQRMFRRQGLEGIYSAGQGGSSTCLSCPFVWVAPKDVFG